MANPAKERLQELAKVVRSSGDSSSHAIKQLLPLLIEMAKDSLVEAEGIELTRLQGEVQALKRLYASFTVEPVSIAKPQAQGE
jgi:hypothetical protein